MGLSCKKIPGECSRACIESITVSWPNLSGGIFQIGITHYKRSKLVSDNHALKAVAKGGGLGIFGMATSTVLQYFMGILIVRILSKTEFCLISLGYVIVTILAMIHWSGWFVVCKGS